MIFLGLYHSMEFEVEQFIIRRICNMFIVRVRAKREAFAATININIRYYKQPLKLRVL